LPLARGKSSRADAVCVIIWAVALMSLCSRRDIDIHSKLSWVVTVLVLNTLGALIYFLFGPKRQASGESPVDADAVPMVPEGRDRGRRSRGRFSISSRGVWQ